MEIELTVLDSLKIYQPRYGYRFSQEPFILMENTNIPDNSVFVDFGSGCGIISILASKKKNRCKIYAVEDNPQMTELIKKNIYLNATYNINVIDSINYIGTNAADIVVSNPPYFFEGSYRKSQRFFKEKFESKSIDEMLKSIRRIIKNKGLLKISCHPTRFVEIVKKLYDYGFGIKKITPVYGNKKNNASFIIVESKFNTVSHCVFEKVIYLEDF